VRKHWLAYGLYVFLGIAGLLMAVWATWLNLRAASTRDGLSLGGGASHRATVIPDLPEFAPPASKTSLLRQANIYTEFPVRPRIEVVRYTVQPGDSVFGIAGDFNIKPETLLMGNYTTLNDDPHLLRPGQELNILPTDGAYYKWQAGDFLPMVANRFHVEVEDILDWVGNDLDPVNPTIEPGTWIVIPGGSRLLTPWLIPTIARGSAGVGAALGPGGCSGDYSGGAVGSGGFIWPTSRHDVVGNDYWSGHLAIDLAVGVGEPVWAADGGVVVYSGLWRLWQCGHDRSWQWLDYTLWTPQWSGRGLWSERRQGTDDWLRWIDRQLDRTASSFRNTIWCGLCKSLLRTTVKKRFLGSLTLMWAVVMMPTLREVFRCQ